MTQDSAESSLRHQIAGPWLRVGGSSCTSLTDDEPSSCIQRGRGVRTPGPNHIAPTLHRDIHPQAQGNEPLWVTASGNTYLPILYRGPGAGQSLNLEMSGSL